MMKNWAGNITWDPGQVALPSSEGAILDLVRKAINDNRKIRLIGTGHSFTALCATDEIAVSLDNYQGIVSVNKEKHQATVKGGTKLNVLGELLFAYGMAMENLGDIDVQSIAGTISTGTHGTGKSFGTISTQIIGIKFINGKGEVVNCATDNNPNLLKAAQVSLGLLGVITEVTLQCVPAYKLEIKNKKENINEVIAEWDQRHAGNRNFEHFWFPYTDGVWTKSSNIVAEGSPTKVGMINYMSEYVLENYVFGACCQLANWFPSMNESISKLSAGSISDLSKIAQSHEVYATQRLVRFKEMEYNVPNEAYGHVMKAIMKIVNSKKFNIHFPIESRIVAADDIYMSPANGRTSAYIAVHVYHKKDHRPYFKAVEEICRAHCGRPHWGKMNTLTNNDVVDLYPEYSKFMEYRNTHDPDKVFSNSYLQKLIDG